MKKRGVWKRWWGELKRIWDPDSSQEAELRVRWHSLNLPQVPWIHNDHEGNIHEGQEGHVHPTFLVQRSAGDTLGSTWSVRLYSRVVDLSGHRCSYFTFIWWETSSCWCTTCVQRDSNEVEPLLGCESQTICDYSGNVAGTFYKVVP